MATVYESGDRLLLAIPQSRQASSDERHDLLDAAKSAASVSMWQRDDTGQAISQGTRPLLQAASDPGDGRIHLAFGPSSEPRIPVKGESARLLLSASTATTGLVVLTATDVTAVRDSLGSRARAALRLPTPTRKVERAWAMREANVRLARATDDASNWLGFRDWLVEQRPVFDREIVEEVLAMALNTPGGAPWAIAMALLLLDGSTPFSQRYACAFASAFSDALLRTERESAPLVLRHAKACLASARESGVQDGDLSLAAARIALVEERWEDACRSYEGARGDGVLLTPEDLDWYLFAAAASGRKDLKRDAVHVLDERLATASSPRELWAFRDALKSAISLREDVGGVAALVEPIERLVRLTVIFEEPSAGLECEVGLTRSALRLEDKLRIISVLEEAESQATLERAASFLRQIAWEALPTAKPALTHDILRQLRAVLEEMGRASDDDVELLEEELAARTAATRDSGATGQEISLLDRIVTLVGGTPLARSRTASQLLGLGSREVRDVPPSWEKRLDQGNVAERVRGSDVVAILTDVVKHDAQQIVVGLKGRPGCEYQIVYTSGGPSRIVRELVRAMAH